MLVNGQLDMAKSNAAILDEGDDSSGLEVRDGLRRCRRRKEDTEVDQRNLGREDTSARSSGTGTHLLMYGGRVWKLATEVVNDTYALKSTCKLYLYKRA